MSRECIWMQRPHRGLENERISTRATAIGAEFEGFPSSGESLYANITSSMVHTMSLQCEFLNNLFSST